MAAVTHAVATVSTLNVTSYAAAAFTPVANDLLVGFVIASQTQALAATLVTDSGITFTLIGRATDCSVQFDDPELALHHSRLQFDGQKWILSSVRGVHLVTHGHEQSHANDQIAN